MRLAFVDTQFAWPPPGGAQIDVYHTMKELRAIGHDVHLFVSPDERLWRFGAINPTKFDLPFTELKLGGRPFDMPRAAEAFRQCITAWKADVVFLCFGFYLKPFLARALAGLPVVARYFTYEALCVRDFQMFQHYDTCPYDYLSHPRECCTCFERSWRHGMLRGESSEFAEEFVHVNGATQEFYDRYVEYVRNLDGIIVYNEMTKARLTPYNERVRIITGGVHVEEFGYTPVARKDPGDTKIILMAGRADDRFKGIDLLIQAGEVLASERRDFEIWVTSSDQAKKRPWLRLVGWREQAAVRELYTQSDICVVPSLWDEPFGLVAVEAMASGRPVVVSEVGGLQHIPIAGETGFVYPRTDFRAMAGYLRQLLDDYDLRLRMGEAGRHRAEQHFDWKVVVGREYPSLLDSVTK